MSAAMLERSRESMAWFQHDSNAASDTKCLRLISRWGNEGYGAWWRLAEMLATATGHVLAVETDEDWLIIGGQIGMDDMDKCRAFIHDLLDIGLLFGDGNGGIASKRMLKNALYFGSQRANGAKGGRPRKSTQASEK